MSLDIRFLPSTNVSRCVSPFRFIMTENDSKGKAWGEPILSDDAPSFVGFFLSRLHVVYYRLTHTNIRSDVDVVVDSRKYSKLVAPCGARRNECFFGAIFRHQSLHKLRKAKEIHTKEVYESVVV